MTNETSNDEAIVLGDFIRNYPKISGATIKSRQRAL